MGRSIYVPHEATLVAYFDASDNEHIDDWDWTVESFWDRLQDTFPSVWPAEVGDWFRREGKIVAINHFGQFGISFYGSLGSIWFIPTDHRAAHWVRQVTPRFNKEFAEYRKLGTMSNGESVYQKIEGGKQ